MATQWLQRHRRDWEELALLDPYWAILSDPGRKYGRWDSGEFFETGEKAVAHMMDSAAELGCPRRWESALDFGCGMGRLTRGLSKRFAHCYGVDISKQMVVNATRLNQDVPNSAFIVSDSLRIFPGNSFDFICCDIVLQHQPTRSVIAGYLTEFLRTLRRGGLLVFQLPHRIPLRNRLQLRRRIYALLRTVGMPEALLYRPLGLHPIRMVAMPEEEVRRHLSAAGGVLLEVHHSEKRPRDAFDSRTYYVTR